MERLILCGGGHVSLELFHIARRLDFDLHIMDDRSEFANTQRFPGAKLYAQDFESALDALDERPDDYFAVLTRGHAYDTQCVARILRRPFAYVGMIGSRRKVAHCRRSLLEMGFTEQELSALHAPIGLALGGQTPAEIAVSIAAELVQVRAARGAVPITPPAGRGMLVTITEKRGSAPRGPGACMLVSPDGSCTGTIGGGMLEFRAAAMAGELLAAGVPLAHHTFDLSHDPAGADMICGGVITVEFKMQ